ncbi:kinase-like domain-containing protein [Ampelomyces quisqualis]|uniref:Kinase-like domain-containing protein n=1 Tax=Ampelomyces quisqualis TaxID=50730 RepID=A0A6A5QJB4_AMPQU|nr:kinase-like domain-containing protein [Ampelomyces quisqualis]
MNPFDFQSWSPTGVRSIIAAGTNHFIGLVNDTTVLKFPRFRRSVREAAVKGLQVEEQILGILGEHPRIIQLKGKHEDGLLLEYLPNGSIERYLQANPFTLLKQRFIWARQAAEGLAYIHAKHNIQSDVSVGNLLLDRQLSIKFCDFQGRLLHPDGTVALDGGSRERSMSSMPRSDHNYCDYRTDIFALGTALFAIMSGQLPFPDLDILYEDEIDRRFENHEFPPLTRLLGGDVVRKCWIGDYKNATEVVGDLQRLETCAG